MEFVIFSLFPEMFQGVLGESIIRRAVDTGAVSIRLVNFRDYATDKHRTVDDYPFGGGAGMLLKPEPMFAAVDDALSLTRKLQPQDDPHVVLMSPQGRPFTQKVADELSKQRSVYLLCGHYEGFDDRIRQGLVDDEISLGDFVLTGGEIAAMAVVDAVTRLLPGVLGNEGSAEDDSFSSGLLEHPQYTRPKTFRGHDVPSVLLSGHHERVRVWRHVHSLYRTWQRRPDLLLAYNLTDADKALIRKWEHGDFSDVEVRDSMRGKRSR